MLLPIEDKQFGFWVMRRKGIPNITIANLLGISRQAVSRGLLTMDKKIDTSLREMANANQIAVEIINVEHGILMGRSIPFNAEAIIFVSEKHGVQVWYKHEGDCDSCQLYKDCIELIWDYSKELGILIKTTDNPTIMADELFEKVKKLI
ncbi:MAG: hypothetical protein LUQ50_08230 [Methanospirillum sp.]|uniref:hypothetical protein n=1 Tax=Methanospirillum sp. TaxID=45200 RepID=UPI002375A672|nr:hypothetical protein [Methanospirillum sp.]MDD1729044.1 hypothetical protein [Methanospirillum sp.]